MRCTCCGTDLRDDAEYCFACNATVDPRAIRSDDAALTRMLVDAAAHHGQGRSADAEALCHRLLDVFPENAAALSLLGDVCVARGRHADAIGYYRRAIQQNAPQVDQLRRKLESLQGVAVAAVAAAESPLPAVTFFHAPPESVPPVHNDHGLLGSNPRVAIVAIAITAVVLLIILLFVMQPWRQPNSPPTDADPLPLSGIEWSPSGPDPMVTMGKVARAEA